MNQPDEPSAERLVRYMNYAVIVFNELKLSRHCEPIDLTVVAATLVHLIATQSQRPLAEVIKELQENHRRGNANTHGRRGRQDS